MDSSIASRFWPRQETQVVFVAFVYTQHDVKDFAPISSFSSASPKSKASRRLGTSHSVLVTFLSLSRESMLKATTRIKSLLDLIVAEG